MRSGETFAGRHSLSHLSNVGLTETIANDLDEYVELAISFAGDLPRLAAVRAGLRERMESSPLCDGKRFATHLASLLRDVWEQRIASSAVTTPEESASDASAKFNRQGVILAKQGKLDEAIANFQQAAHNQSRRFLGPQ